MAGTDDSQTGAIASSTRKQGSNTGMQQQQQRQQHAAQMHYAVMHAVQQIVGTEVSENDPLMDAGLDSLGAVELKGSIEKAAGMELPVTLVFDYPTAGAIARYLTAETAEDGQEHDELVRASQAPAMNKHDGAPCFNTLLVSDLSVCNQKWSPTIMPLDLVTLPPSSHCDWLEVSSPVPAGMVTLPDVDLFDSQAYMISHSEAKFLDPQQRQLLHAISQLRTLGRLTSLDTVGIYAGISATDFSRIIDRSKVQVNPYMGTGISPSVCSGRISYCFGFQGPALTVDTACSSSLVTTTLACQSLQGDTTAAISCGANVILTPHTTLVFHQAGMLSIDSRCKTLDKSADGYVRAEGCAALTIDTTLDETRPVLVSLVGSAVNQDGRSSSFTAPSGQAQSTVICRAFAQGRTSLNLLSLLQLHGTGTSLGDPIEIGGMRSAMNRQTSPQKLLLQAAKSTLGHAESAAGVNAFVTAINVLCQDGVNPVKHLVSVNPHVIAIPLQAETMTVAGGVHVPRQTEMLQTNHAAHGFAAGVSAFAFQGTNAHCVMTKMHSSYWLGSQQLRLGSKQVAWASSFRAQDWYGLRAQHADSTLSVKHSVEFSLQESMNAHLWDHVQLGRATLPAGSLLLMGHMTGNLHRSAQTNDAFVILAHAVQFMPGYLGSVSEKDLDFAPRRVVSATMDHHGHVAIGQLFSAYLRTFTMQQSPRCNGSSGFTHNIARLGHQYSAAQRSRQVVSSIKSSHPASPLYAMQSVYSACVGGACTPRKKSTHKVSMLFTGVRAYFLQPGGTQRQHTCLADMPQLQHCGALEKWEGQLCFLKSCSRNHAVGQEPMKDVTVHLVGLEFSNVARVNDSAKVSGDIEGGAEEVLRPNQMLYVQEWTPRDPRQWNGEVWRGTEPEAASLADSTFFVTLGFKAEQMTFENSCLHAELEQSEMLHVDKDLHFSSTKHVHLLMTALQRNTVMIYNNTSPERTPSIPIRSAQQHLETRCESLLRILQTMLNTQFRERQVTMWMLSPLGAPHTDIPSLILTPLQGLITCGALEAPGKFGGILETDGRPVSGLHQCLTHPGMSKETRLTVRDGRWYASRVRQAPKIGALSNDNNTWSNKPGYTATVIGGLDGLGGPLAKSFAAAQGACLLVSRNPLRSRQVLQELAEEDGAVWVVKRDASNTQEMQALSTWAREWLPPQNKVMMAAGVSAYEPIDSLSSQGFGKVCEPKIMGALLSAQTIQPLEQLFLFSSISSVWGQKGMSHYA
eukprot:gene22437-27075_t